MFMLCCSIGLCLSAVPAFGRLLSWQISLLDRGGVRALTLHLRVWLGGTRPIMIAAISLEYSWKKSPPGA